jgi:hypothetical protein
VRTILRGAWRAAGEHLVTWDGCDDAGRRARPGMYFVRLAGGGGEPVGRSVVRLE